MPGLDEGVIGGSAMGRGAQGELAPDIHGEHDKDESYHRKHAHPARQLDADGAQKNGECLMTNLQKGEAQSRDEGAGVNPCGQRVSTRVDAWARRASSAMTISPTHFSACARKLARLAAPWRCAAPTRASN